MDIVFYFKNKNVQNYPTAPDFEILLFCFKNINFTVTTPRGSASVHSLGFTSTPAVMIVGHNCLQRRRC